MSELLLFTLLIVLISKLRSPGVNYINEAIFTSD